MISEAAQFALDEEAPDRLSRLSEPHGAIPIGEAAAMESAHRLGRLLTHPAECRGFLPKQLVVEDACAGFQAQVAGRSQGHDELYKTRMAITPSMAH